MASAQKSGCDVGQKQPARSSEPLLDICGEVFCVGPRNAIEMWRTPRLADFEVDKALSHLDCARLCPAVQADALTESSPYRAKVNQPFPADRREGSKSVLRTDSRSTRASRGSAGPAASHFRISAIRIRTVSASTTTG